MAGPVMGTFCSQKEITGNLEEVFEDILEERRISSDLRYATKSFTPVIYKNLTPCTSSALKSFVMDSENLQHIIKQISVESGEPFHVVQNKAVQILDEMSHNLKLGAIRLFAFGLSKIFKRLYQKVFVNQEGMHRLAKAIQEHPVVLLPSHRSYIDFLLISYIMFTYDLPIPVIAAGEDLSRMKFVGPFLRLSGAFFIRRTFHGEKLYWAVFSEYVKTMIRTGYAPVEFFIEGQRSRSGKTIHPRLGLLNVVSEPFFRGEVYDTYLVPISISYEKILEESFYAQELLGAQKSKESTSGLIKARKILNDNFGNIHIYVGRPISLRSMASERINRYKCNLTHRHSLQRPSKDIQKFISAMAYKVELHQIANMVLSPGDLIATILLQNLPLLNYDLLVEKILWLRKLTEDFGGVLDWPDNIYQSFCFLRNLFSKEFILFHGCEEQDFEEGCLLLSKLNVISRTPYDIFMNENDSVGQFLYGMLYSALEGYQLACTYIQQNLAESFTDKQYIAGVRNYVFKHILSGATKCFDALSSDFLRNTLASLVHLGIVKVRKTSGETLFSADIKAVSQAIATLEVPSRKFPASRL
ncbi:dihydroxyacetone phosphate acyltransferase-like isoform X4 [Dendrobates tinctorius]|uniref:dihydroxyacetone phosphate acyltransferase-like isoform X4 n=1 Tax=Dendrobates tinctorius TaxID=92724 RepID=UPI003CCA2050